MTFSQVFRQGIPQSPALRKFAALISGDAAAPSSWRRTPPRRAASPRQHFGKTMRLFAPLYLSNECVNICKYCGFSRDNPILRTTLTLDQVESEARHLAEQGFRSILLVAGEHPKFVSSDYLAACTERVRAVVPAVSLEVGPLEAETYAPIVAAGAEGLIVFQESYDRAAYAELHTAGPKKDFDWRLDTPERAYAAGFRRLGLGALFGLAPWKEEALALAAHADHLLRNCWKASLNISLPRLRPAAGEFQPRHAFDDRDLVQYILALRLTFPQVGLTLSTRESALLRDALAPLGITLMSAGSHTEPGGYTGQGRDTLHRTEKGKAVPLIPSETAGAEATVQFEISDARDARTPAQVAARLRELGFEPVWKDWDTALVS